ncbi:MAG: VWA domain-containing protein [Anaerolineales bacterium]|nr:VWA domain-containing protein [Anaerolineales bacterium]
MVSTEKYKNLANSDHPATLIYLVDISGSMGAAMPDGRTRIEAVKDVIQISYTQMIQRSLRQGKIHPRYRVGMVAYSDDIYDVYGKLGSIITVDRLKDEGVPSITPHKGTNMAKAFRYAIKLIQDDIISWSERWLNECPPPMVINITDCEYGEETQDPAEFAKQLKEISVPDGNVLVENIFITDQITLSSQNINDWNGYRVSESTGDPYGDKLLAMSSRVPAGYAQIMSEQAGLKIREGTAMMFPGVSQEFIKTGFVMSMVTGSQIKGPQFRSRYEEDDGEESTVEEQKQATRITKEKVEREAAEKSQYKAMELEAKRKMEREENQKIAREKTKYEAKKSKSLKISVAYPKLISKGSQSTFLFYLYLPDSHLGVQRSIRKANLQILENLKDPEKILEEQVEQASHIKLGQKVKVEFTSHAFLFTKNEILQELHQAINEYRFSATPTDNCKEGVHEILVLISDAKTGYQIESLTIRAKVVDYAFDHVSHPMLSRVSAVVLGVGSFAMFILTSLEQIDKTVGLTSGTAAGVFALGIYASFYNLYQRVRPNTP